MGSDIQTFEVRVEVPIKGSRHFSSHVEMFIENKVTKLFHKDARTGEQAMQRCEKYGRPIGYRKADVERMSGNIENCLSAQSNPYPNAIAMDEMIWKKKDKRNERLNNQAKHKSGH